MKTPGHTIWTRSRLLRACLAIPAAYVLAACSGRSDGKGAPAAAGQSQTGGAAPASAPASLVDAARTAAPAQPTPGQPSAAQALPPTPACGDADDVTPAQTEGPYFTPNSSERASLLEPGMKGTRLAVTGYVLTTACRPVAGALLDFWQADDAGAYDNAGYRLRGHQFTDAAGRYQLETIVPGLYPGRTRHIHVKVQAPNQPVLTTQLYFPGEPRNATDGIFNKNLVMAVGQSAGDTTAAFNFILKLR